LGHARIAIEGHAGLDKPVNFAVQVFNDPPEHRVGRCADLVHGGDAKLARGGLVDQRKGARVDKLETKDACVEALSSV